MCGIAGLVAADVRWDAARLERMVADVCRRLAHRGPDGEGLLVQAPAGLALGHRRLAIIDPTAASAQPMRSRCGRFALTFNGEVYNFRGLADALRQAGVIVRTQGDTEVVLEALIAWGVDALTRLRGMFALAWANLETGEVLLARDRYGMKPLYLTRTDGAWAFASELEALRGSGLTSSRPDPAAVLGFLSWGSIPAPRTWIEGVESLRPGTWTRLARDGARTDGVFADVRAAFQDRPAAGRRAADLEADTAAALDDAVRAHLVSDVPVGLFLSGGLDSSALAATTSRLGLDLEAFTVAMPEAALNEADAARAFARQLGLRHRVVPAELGDVEATVRAALARLDQPTQDAVNTFVVARAVATAGIKVALAGTGGDEVFGGYPSFDNVPRGLRLLSPLHTGSRALPGPLRRAARAGLLALAAPRRRAKWSRLLQGAPSVAGLYRAQRGLFTPDELAALAGERLAALGTAPWEAWRAAEDALLAPPGRAETTLAQVSRLEHTVYLRSQLLRDTDVASMAHGLEVRVPFVDHVLLDTVWPRLGAAPDLLRHKAVLRRVCRPSPPPAPPGGRRGFVLPFDRWLRADLEPLLADGVDSAVRSGWLAPPAAEVVLREWRASQLHWSRPWALAVLGHFVSRSA